MENIKEYTPTELLNKLNNLKLEHEKIKISVLENINIIENLEVKINQDIILISELEEEYIKIIEEINNR